MYKFYASINENKVVTLDLDKNFQINKDLFLTVSEQEKPKIFFLCSPNNPTGNSIQDLEFFIENFNGIVVVDEAYIEFSEQKSCIELLEKYPNLITLQTFSKAWGMAGARVGVAYSSDSIIQLINTVKAPYNVNSLSLNIIMQLINYKIIIEENIKNTLSEISRLKNELLNVECVKRVFPTDANFFLIEFTNAEKVYQELLKNEILTSKRSPQIPDCIRINVGKKEENNKLINVLKGI
jgi:histidinol-phosphate aminotransferase